jgi:hypothetical protein
MTTEDDTQYMFTAIAQFCKRCAYENAGDTVSCSKRCPTCSMQWSEEFKYCGDDGTELLEVAAFCKNKNCELRPWNDFKLFHP